MNKLDKILIILSSGKAYKEEIYERFSILSKKFDLNILVDDEAKKIHNYLQWALIAKSTFELSSKKEFNIRFEDYKYIIVPFFDVSLLANIAHGGVMADINSINRYINKILMQNIKLFAFDYNCNPNREYFKIKPICINEKYNDIISNNFKICQNLGIYFIEINIFFDYINNDDNNKKLFIQQDVKIAKDDNNENKQVKSISKFITLNDILNGYVIDNLNLDEYKLTDLAREYLIDKTL